MTVTITAEVRDVTGRPDNTVWWFTSALRESDGTIVSTRTRAVTPEDGALTVELEPGNAAATYGGDTYVFTVPETDADLWDLIEAAVASPPDTAAEALAAAVESYLDEHGTSGTVTWDDVAEKPSTFTPASHTHPSSQISDSTALGRSLLASSNASDARDVLGAGTASTKADVGLGNADNTSDANKPVSTATQTALNAKEDAANKGVAGGYASLDGGGKVPGSQLPSSLMEYQGVWNASTNSPALADGSGGAGDVYRVGTGGTRDLGSGSVTFDVGDYVIYNGSTWEKSDTTDSVASVNSKTGNVTLTQDDIASGSTNKAYTGTEQTKLAGVETGATANDTDANLKARANHTGTQTASTISDFGTAADARITAAVGTTVQAYDSDLAAFAAKTAPSGAVVGTSDTQTLTGKTIDGGNNTLQNVPTSALGTGKVTGSVNGTATSLIVWTGTEAQFTAIGSKDSSTIYFRTA